MIASTVIVLLITLCFTVIFFSKQYSIKVTSKYPTVACEPLKETYNQSYEFWAIEEWKGYYEADSAAEKRAFTGVLPCYCQDKYAELGAFNTLKYEVKDGETVIQPCKEFVEDIVKSLGWSNAVKYMIIGINYALRIILIKLCIYMAKTTESEQTELVTNSVFVGQFFNTAILLLLVNANLAP